MAFATTGDITIELFLYDFDSTTYSGDNYSGIAPCQRVKVCATHNKGTYNANAIANGILGDFDSNFQYASVTLTKTPPLEGQPFNPSGDDLLIAFHNSGDEGTATDHILCPVFNINEDWALTTVFLTFKYVFKVSDGVSTFYDEVRKIVKLTIKDYSVAPEIDLVSIQDPSGSNIDLGLFQICNDLDGIYCANYTTNLTEDHSALGFIGGQEEDEYPNDNLSQKDAEHITEVVPFNPINNLNPWQLKFNSEGFVNDVENCIKTVLIQESNVPVETTCVCPEVELCTEIGLINAVSKQVLVDWTILTPIPPATVQLVQLFRNGTQLLGTWTGVTFGSASYFTNLADPDDDFTLFLTTTDGCSYEYNYTLILAQISGGGDCDAIFCPVPCMLSIMQTVQSCTVDLTLENESLILQDDDEAPLRMQYDERLSYSCGLADNVNTRTWDSPQTVTFNYLLFTVPGNPISITTGGYIDTFRVSAYDGVMGMVVATLDIDLSALIVPAGGGNDPTWIASVEAAIDAAIAAWNIPGYGIGHLNNVDYRRTTGSTPGLWVQWYFGIKHHPAGLWIGIDDNNFLMSYNPDGVSPLINATLQGPQFSTLFSQAADPSPCGNLAGGYSLNNVMDGVNTELWEWAVNPSINLTSPGMGLPDPADYQETCMVTILTASLSPCTGGEVYNWTTPTGEMQSGASIAALIPGGTYSVEASCDECPQESAQITV